MISRNLFIDAEQSGKLKINFLIFGFDALSQSTLI